MTREIVFAVCILGATVSVGNASTLTAHPNTISGVWESVQVDSTTGMHVIAMIQFFEDGSFVWEANALPAPVTLVTPEDAGAPRSVMPSVGDAAWFFIGSWHPVANSDSLVLAISDAEVVRCKERELRRPLVALHQFLNTVMERRHMTVLHHFSQYALSFYTREEDVVARHVPQESTPFSTTVWQWNRIYESVHQ
ncbi:MAG: hypothetical protein OYG31_03275 [Candidatus Kaiserbacteria bacterium]|nr:hypothetical protein [Candidatus Kaiserbacteria bacterium]